jgi:putative ABC transport system permease protein
MTLSHIAWSYLWNRRLTTSLTILSVALAVGLISSVLTMRDETRRRFEEEGQAFDIVVGAKGSPLQLVLSCVYFMDVPTGNVRLSDYERMRAHEDVAHAYPLGLGDTYKGFRIVGTTRELFDYTWTNPATLEKQEPFQLAHGRFFERPMEAVVGGLVARQTGLKVGDSFVGMHGFIELPADLQDIRHDHTPYKVTGVLKLSGTPNDRAIFAGLESVWKLHEKHEEPEEGHEHSPEVTAILLDLQSPALRFQFKEYVNEDFNAMAAIPTMEIAKLYDQLLSTAKTVLLTVGYLVVIISALSILIGLYLSILQRRHDLAIMRALGASASEIFGAVLIEAFWVTLLGIGAGWLLGNAVTWVLGFYLARQVGMGISTFSVSMEQATAYAIVALVGVLAGILPAWQAYRTDVARHLAEG